MWSHPEYSRSGRLGAEQRASGAVPWVSHGSLQPELLNHHHCTARCMLLGPSSNITASKSNSPVAPPELLGQTAVPRRHSFFFASSTALAMQGEASRSSSWSNKACLSPAERIRASPMINCSLERSRCHTCGSTLQARMVSRSMPALSNRFPNASWSGCT